MPKRLMFRPGPIALSLLIAGIAGAALFLAFRDPPLPVDTGTVTRGPMEVTVSDEGETRVHDLYIVAAPIAGRLERIELHAGDKVKAGKTLIARLRPADPDFLDRRAASQMRAEARALDAALASARARIREAETQRDLMKSEQARIATLAERGFATKAALDRANAALAQAEAVLAEARQASETARYQRDAARAGLIDPTTARQNGTLDVIAPVSGTVMRLARQSESIVAAGSPLVEIGDPEKLEIVTDLLSADAVQVKEGAAVRIERWGGEPALNGRVRTVEPYGFTKVSALGVEEQRVNIVIDLTDPPARWARLGHGFRVVVRIVTWQGDKVLQLPASALFRDSGRWSAFAVREGRARLVRLAVTRMNEDSAAIAGGLSPGDRVILYPSERISDGVRVTQRQGSAPARRR